MKLPGQILTILVFYVLCATGAHAAEKLPYYCTTQACVKDAEQTRAAIRAYEAAKTNGSPVVIAPDVPPDRRWPLIQQLEEVLGEAAGGKRAYVTSASYFDYVDEKAPLFCGSAIYVANDGRRDGGVFVVDLRTNGSIKLHATKEEFGHAGCASQGTSLR